MLDNEAVYVSAVAVDLSRRSWSRRRSRRGRPRWSCPRPARACADPLFERPCPVRAGRSAAEGGAARYSPQRPAFSVRKAGSGGSRCDSGIVRAASIPRRHPSRGASGRAVFAQGSGLGVLEQELGREARKELLPMQPGDVPTTYADVDDLARDVDFRPATSMEEGIRRFATWYRKLLRGIGRFASTKIGSRSVR